MSTVSTLTLLSALLVAGATEPSGQYSFQNKGKLTNIIEMAHLVIPVDFSELERQIHTFCKAVRTYRDFMKVKEGEYLLGYTSNRLGYTAMSRCLEIEDNFNSIKSVWANTDMSAMNTKVKFLNRPARQLAILTFGVLSVLTCFSQIYSQSQMFSLLKQTEENSNDAVMKLDALASRVQLNDENIQILNKTVDMIRISLQSSIATLTDVQAGMAFHVLINSLDTKLTHITNGLAMLGQHKLSPLLIRPLYLVKPLQDLQTQLMKRNIIISLDNVFELFSLDVSHSMLVNGTLLIYVHIPCYHPGQLMDLHELHPVPVRLPTLPPSYVLPYSSTRFLAISHSCLLYTSPSPRDRG